MKKKKNAGVSIVEVVIALAIFMVMMIPIVKGIVTSLNRSTDAKELQYRNEFAEAVMEHVKSVDITEILDEQYYTNLGATNVNVPAGPTLTNVTATYDADGDGVNDELTSASYEITGKIKLGTKKTEYNYAVVVDNSYYVNKKATDEDFIDPNNLALGIVEDIDHTKVALIDDNVLNCDSVASEAFLTKKLQKLKQVDPERYEQQIAQAEGTSLFIQDTASRLMKIEVSGDSSDGYTVRCVLSYIDHDQSQSVLGNDNYVEYSPYGRTFTGELPNIYVMYNPCYYGSNYSKDDYIAIDTSGLKDDSEVNVFIIETAETYSQSIKTAETELKNKDSSYSSIVTDKSGDKLINTVASNGVYRKDVNVHLIGVNTSSSPSFLEKIHVYHNFMDFSSGGNSKDENGLDKENVTTSINQFLYKESDVKTGDTYKTLNSFFEKINAGTLIGQKKFYGMTGNSAEASVMYLNGAEDENRGLYQVKVYINEGNIDTSKDIPILQSSKGGNET